MNKENVFTEVARGLARHGLSPEDALRMVKLTRSRQTTEWERILDACQRGEISRVYIVSAPHDESFAVLVYAPAEKDNIRHVMDFVSQGPVGSEDPRIGHYPASSFDISDVVKRAVALEVERDRVLRDTGSYIG